MLLNLERSCLKGKPLKKEKKKCSNRKKSIHLTKNKNTLLIFSLNIYVLDGKSVNI